MNVYYLGNHSGDLYIKAKIGSLESSVNIEDCCKYDATEYTCTGTGSATSVATNNYAWSNTVDWELTADIKVTGNACRIDVVPPSESLVHHLGIGKNSAGQLTCYVGNQGGIENQNIISSQTMTNNTYYTVKIRKEGTTIKFYCGDTLVHTDNTYAKVWISNYSTESVKFTTWQSNKIYLKNMKVKPL